MNRKLSIYISISAVAAFSVPAIAKDTPGSTSTGSGQFAMPPQNSRASIRPALFGQDAHNADLAITARIREGISARKNLSVYAGNVKVLTTGGRVVLKGAVISEEEKRLIGNIASGVQQRENVDNQLVVGTPPSAPTGLRVVQ